jgi:hypothetical protein
MLCEPLIRITDVVLGGAIRDAEKGFARPGQGKSSGFQALIVFRAIFVHGFAKNEKDNIEKDELVGVKKLANGCWP